MKNINTTISQIIFSLTFIVAFQFLFKDFYDFLFYYLFFHWLWLTFLARKSSLHILSDTRSKKLTNINIIVSISWFFILITVMFLSGSFGFRLIFAVNNVYQIILGLGLVIWLFSIIGHIIVTIRNLRNIIPDCQTSNTVIRLLLYPWGIWTIQAAIQKTTNPDI